MNKVELISAIHHKLKGWHTKKDIELILTATCDCIVEAVAEGDSVRLVGFGTFSKKERKGRLGRNPATGENIEIPKSMVAKFSAGKLFKESVKA